MKILWLGNKRGALTDWSTQQWVKATGQKISLRDMPWLDGPVGESTKIGGDFFGQWAKANQLVIRQSGTPRGLLQNLDDLAGASFDPTCVHSEVRRFYEQTSAYELEAWAEWTGRFRPFGSLVAALFSRRLEQLNVPLSALDTSRGTTSEVLHLVDPETERVISAAWVRHLRGTGRVLYAGSYSVCRIPGYPSPCVRVVFPLPNGNGIVILRPEVDEHGSLRVVSSGSRFGDPGFYFTVHRPEGHVWARYVRTMKEEIRVYAGEHPSVRADHTMRLFGQVFLRLHYLLRPDGSVLAGAT